MITISIMQIALALALAAITFLENRHGISQGIRTECLCAASE